jgi:phytoene dehydrogenase-like protein
VQKLRIADGRVVGALVTRAGEPVEVDADVFVSNAGPRASVELCGRERLPAHYVELIDERVRPTPMIVINLASREPLLDEAGIVFFADTSRVCAIAHLTSACPELAPEGWHLYVAYAVPVPALGAFDEDAEVALTTEELRRELRHFDDARVLSSYVVRDEWPAQRAVAGSEAPRATPLPNLWNVGDGARAYGDGGMQACAQTAKDSVAEILATHRHAPRRRVSPVATTTVGVSEP